MDMPQIGRAAKLIGLTSVFMLTSCNPATGPADAVFEDVGASGKWEDAGQITRQFGDPRAVPRYLVFRGRLYLLTQITQPHLLDVFVVEKPEWRAAELTALIETHPELRRYAENGRWVRMP